MLAACPVLIIDDEADQASVNTAKPDRQPTTINGLIRDIVNGAPKSAYVGYTATPFANVLIDPKDYEDLYPRDFIVDLPRPEVYIGPEAIFGREPLEFDAEDVEDDGNDFVRSRPRGRARRPSPKGAAKRHVFEPQITESLDDALRYFLLSTAARRVRGKGNRHATALVHTSQHIDVHERMADAIKAPSQLAVDTARAPRPSSVARPRSSMWVEECERVPADDFGLDPVAWDRRSRRCFRPSPQAAEVITDNSRSTERLELRRREPASHRRCRRQHASRGLTLEGLSVSFFVRTASAYDTLLQMGRWFGYRNGYADLTRIWMTDEMREWFHHLATVEQEIRYDIERYEIEHMTPEELGLRIRTHPKLAITAAAKMQHARVPMLPTPAAGCRRFSFNHRDRDWLSTNIDAARVAPVESADGARNASSSRDHHDPWPVDSQHIIDFLSAYHFHENSRDLDGELISRYILSRRDEGELTHVQHRDHGAHAVTSDYLGEVDLGLDREGRLHQPRPARGGRRRDLCRHQGSDEPNRSGYRSRSARRRANGQDIRRTISSSCATRPRRGGGFGDGSGLLLLYPVSKDSRPVRGSAKTRDDPRRRRARSRCWARVPGSRCRAAKVDYVTANVAAMTAWRSSSRRERTSPKSPRSGRPDDR